VVSTNLASGVPYVNLNGQTGLVVPPADHRALAEALARLIGDAALREKLGRQARARALREFTAERMCARVGAVYRRVLGS
jgi:glycosyltransferase involved in cell wall biosynthesis